MAQPATSGTLAYSFDQRKVIDHAARRAGFQAQMLTAENILIAQDCLYSLMQEWCNAGFPLWTRQFYLLGVAIGQPEVTTAAGTLEVIHSYWRTLNPWRGGATLSTNGDGGNLFLGQAITDITIAGPNPGVAANFVTTTEVDTVGVLLGGATTITAALQILTSSTGSSYTLAQTLPSATYTPGSWVYFDLDPVVSANFVQLRYASSNSLTLQQVNFGLANGTDIQMGPLNIDDYYNLPQRVFQGDRPVSAFVDRQLAAPVIKLWPTPNSTAFYNGCVSVLARRYLQDPGAMAAGMEVPPRALEALIWRLASRLIWELPDKGDVASIAAKQQRIPLIDQNAAKAEALWWSEERNKSPIRILPNISPYTA